MSCCYCFFPSDLRFLQSDSVSLICTTNQRWANKELLVALCYYHYFCFYLGWRNQFSPNVFFLGFFFLSAWLVYIQPHLNITGLVSPETHSKRSGTWFWLPTATFTSKQVHICSSSTNRHSSPLIYLSCRFISSSRGPDCGSRTEPPG